MNLFGNGVGKLKFSIYLTVFSSKHPMLNYIYMLMKNEYIDTFVCSSPFELFSNSFDEDEIDYFKAVLQSHCKNVFFYDSKLRSIHILYREIECLRVKNNTSIIITISDELFKNTVKNEEIIFVERLKLLAIEKKLTINLLIYGQNINFIKKTFSQRPDLCVGYSTLENIDKNSYFYYVYYWGLDSGMRGESENYLTLNDERSFVMQSERNKEQSISFFSVDDENTIYISQTAIEYDQKIVDSMICAPTNKELEQCLSGISKSTIVFGCSQQDEVRQLGVKIYRLRKRFGNNIKIIVREMKPCLRYSDEMYLLQAGINRIIHFGTQFSRMLNAIEILRGQILTRPLPSSIDELVNFGFKTTELNGYVNNNTFILHTKQVIKQIYLSRTEFLLIKLEILPSINPQYYLNVCNIKRKGDLMTICDDFIYLFLQGVRISDLSIALRNIFTLPIHDIFLSQISFTTSVTVEYELANIIPEKFNFDVEIKDINTINDSLPTSPQFEVITAQHKPLDF